MDDIKFYVEGPEKLSANDIDRKQKQEQIEGTFHKRSITLILTHDIFDCSKKKIEIYVMWSFVLYCKNICKKLDF